jgi:hypothetical protein
MERNIGETRGPAESVRPRSPESPTRLTLQHQWVRLCLAVIAGLTFSLLNFAQASKSSEGARSRSSFSPRDLSGIWMERQNLVTFSDQEPPMTPWALAKFRAAKPGYGPRATSDSQDPLLSCVPPGVPRIMLIPFPMQIVQTPSEVIMLFEYDHHVRHIYLDRREHRQDLGPTWMGDSIGKWEGDTLVVDTTGLNDKTWLDQVGHPHSDALHVIEHIRRVDRDTLQDDLTIDDPRAYTKPWTGQQVFKLKPTWHLFEYVCEDNMAVPNR